MVAPKAQRVLICGSREYANLDEVKSFVAKLPPGTTVISGGARGVDRTAAEAARAYGLHVIVMHADWQRYGAKAGPIRNRQMLDACDRVVAFWDGKSPGTRDTIVEAERRRTPTLIIRVDTPPREAIVWTTGTWPHLRRDAK